MSNQMKISLIIFSLLLATLLHGAQGMNRKLLNKTTNTISTPIASSSLEKLKVEENTTETKPNEKTSRTTAQNPGGKTENFSDKSSPVPQHREAVPEYYPDVLDIAGMDYSPARRKSPIHN